MRSLASGPKDARLGSFFNLIDRYRSISLSMTPASIDRWAKPISCKIDIERWDGRHVKNHLTRGPVSLNNFCSVSWRRLDSASAHSSRASMKIKLALELRRRKIRISCQSLNGGRGDRDVALW